MRRACLTFPLTFSLFLIPLQVQIFLGDKDIQDLASLDAVLSDFLSLEALRSDMESFRDEIIDYYMQVRAVSVVCAAAFECILCLFPVAVAAHVT